jgi:hypothetical protein
MIIGVVGYAGSGKGTVGDILSQTYGYEKFAFADTLKDVVSVMFGWPRHLLEGDTDESRAFREAVDPFWTAKFGYQVTPRHMLQIVGTEASREVLDDNIWVHSLERRIQGHPKVVITDCRFPNEIKFIKEAGGFVVRVVRGPEPEWYDTAYAHITQGRLDMHQKYPEVHVSEWAWIGSSFDYVLDNNGSKSELEASVKYMLKIFTGPINMEIIS